MINIAMLIAILCAVLVLVVMFSIIMKKDKLEYRVRDQFDDLISRLRDQQERLTLIEAHAVDYANSLGEGGIKVLTELRDSLNAITALMTEVESLIATKDLGALEEAQLLMNGKHPDPDSVLTAQGAARGSAILGGDWEGRLEELMQEIGSRVSSASMSAAEAGLPKREKKERTLFSLFKARVYTGKGPYEW